MNNLLIYILSTLCVQFSYSQIDISKAIEYSNNEEYKKTIKSLTQIDTIGASLEDRALWLFYMGYAYNNIDKQDLAYIHIQDAKSLYTKLKQAKDIKDCNIQLLSILKHQNNLNDKKETDQILRELQDYVNVSKNDDKTKIQIYRELGSNLLDIEKNKEAIKIFEQSFSISSKINDSLEMAFALSNLGASYVLDNKPKTAIINFKKALPILLKFNDSLNISYVYNNIANSFKHLKYCDSALYYYKKAEKINISKNRNKSKSFFYDNISKVYEQCDDLSLALNYIKKRDSVESIINDASQNQALIDAERKYKTSEKEKALIISDKEKNQNKNVAIGLAALLILGGTIAVLLQKNTKRKQRIAEQEREIEIQKTEKILKEQELNTIDAMLAGQEKERKKLAADLHDSVGATLAAAKLQFNHLSQHRDNLKEMDELFSKTGVLLDDAYTEIRAMAHLKNSGVIAKNGLLPALEKLAKNASSTNGLQVTIENFGLEQRLESAEEITIFRVIQELVTNIIKHAQATEANISLTPHEKELSIIIEDNGIGFNPRKIVKDKGMGLANIERRIEHLEGTLEVDSTPGKGTTILIDIPL